MSNVRRNFVHALALLAAGFALAPAAPAQAPAPSTGPGTAPSRLPKWVDLRREHTPRDVIFALNVAPTPAVRASLARRVGAVSQRVLWAGQLFLLTLPEGADLVAALETLNADPRVRYAEPNSIYHVGATTPDDPSFPSQWGFNEANDHDIDAPEAWDLQTDASSVIVAVIDTGIDYTHPDLAANIWTNPGEIAGNGIDDDGNGYVDDIHGIDVVNGDSDPMDDHGHGTHVSGTIGAVSNNATGVAGCCWKARIMGVKFLSAGGSGTEADAVVGLAYAVANGAQLSNNSWGGFGFDQGLYDAIKLAGDSCHLFCAAAGNSAIDIEGQQWIPGGYDLDNIVCVAATDINDNRAWFSNWGAVSVDLAAPGDGILSTWPGNNYISISGTSMATPHVCGVATMLFARSGITDDLQVKKWLMDSVDPNAAFAGLTVTGGRLNYRAALDQIPAPPTLPTSGILLSLDADTTIGSFSCAKGDVIHLDPTTGIYSMLLKLGAVLPSATPPNVSAVGKLADGSLLLAFDTQVAIPCLKGGPNGNLVDPQDLVRFVPLQWGDATLGHFEFYFDGSDVGLDTTSEGLDGVTLDGAGNLLLSTKGKYSVNGGALAGKHSDVLAFAPTALGAVTAGTFSLFFNGRDADVKLGSPGENVDAISFDPATHSLTLSTGGNFRVPPSQFGQNDDLLLFAGTQWGSDTNGTFTIPFDGALYGLDPSNVDAVELLP